MKNIFKASRSYPSIGNTSHIEVFIDLNGELNIRIARFKDAPDANQITFTKKQMKRFMSALRRVEL
jgi:hypothetical protein